MKNYIEYYKNNPFTYNSSRSILEEKDIGICADIASMMTPPTSVFAMKTFQGCPYTNTGFCFDIKLDGESVRCDTWDWLPSSIIRYGKTDSFEVTTLTSIIPGQRTAVQKITIKNTASSSLKVPFAITFRGKTRKEEKWAFSIPKPSPCTRDDFSCNDGILLSSDNGASFALTCSLPDMHLFLRAYMWESEIEVKSGETLTVYVSAHTGEVNETLANAKKAKSSYKELIDSSFTYLSRETKRIYDNLPQLSSDNAELDNLYYRSLVTYIMCRWENPDLCTIPYYSTGGINGGCMCSYLWDYCGGLMMHPIYDPEGNKKQLRAYLINDLTRSYSLNPVTAGPEGPWYQVNQEKIILMVYHHILATGEVEFLHEKVGDKTVIEWMKYHAYVCDDLSREAELYDYGVGGDDHLEIAQRGNGPYNGIMPDLNARRYMNYMRVYEMTVAAGEPDERLPVRAAALKEKLKLLWNDGIRWYDFIDANGNRDTRYTVQMFKFLNSGVIDEKEREGLISHLNEREFLSKFGLHSMSKLDTQYDQDDIDNGGGGICTHFTMQICAQLYETGYDALATDILRRVYWWGTRMPYMGDSCAANMIANREDTPLQGDISSVSCAQMIFFYIFGIKAHFDGRITVSPVKNRPAENMKIENAHLCGKVFSVEITGDTFKITLDGKETFANVGEIVTI